MVDTLHGVCQLYREYKSIHNDFKNTRETSVGHILMKVFVNEKSKNWRPTTSGVSEH